MVLINKKFILWVITFKSDKKYYVHKIASAAHLAAYAGLAPVSRRSGSSIRGEHPTRRGNKTLKRALFLSASAALRDPISRAY